MARYTVSGLILGLVLLCCHVTGQEITNYVTPPLTTAATIRYALILKELSAVTQGRAALSAGLTQYRGHLAALKQQMQQKRASCSCIDDAVIAFTAHLNQDVTILGADQPIPFDNVTLNSGNGYDVRHAQFRAPVSGTYAFYVTLLTHAGYKIVADVFLNGISVVKVRTGNPNQFNVGSNAVTLHLQKGDDVWLQHDHTITDSNRLYDDEGMLSTFSGYLVSRD